MGGEKKVSIFEYDNYRDYLKDFYLQAKASKNTFSVRNFSRVAGFKSSGVFNQVLSGKRNIAPQSISKFVKALRLNQEEGFFFKNLVLLNQSKTAEERQHYARELLRSKNYRKIHPLNASQFNYFARWYYVVIREMVTLEGFKEDYNWISRQIMPPISSNEARKAIEELIKLQLLSRTSQGKLVLTEPHITTADEVAMGSVAQYHKVMIDKAAQSIDTIPREKRELSAITLGMSAETAHKVKEMIQNFRKSIVEFISKEANSTKVYQINMHLFPLVDLDETGAEIEK
jgi:uncharacterized protein (TIGR02147 family)